MATKKSFHSGLASVHMAFSCTLHNIAGCSASNPCVKAEWGKPCISARYDPLLSGLCNVTNADLEKIHSPYNPLPLTLSKALVLAKIREENVSWVDDLQPQLALAISYCRNLN